jgi:hypothetical protein
MSGFLVDRMIHPHVKLIESSVKTKLKERVAQNTRFLSHILTLH